MGLKNISRAFIGGLDGLGQWLSPLGLRLFLAWEFGEAGWEKLHGENWFADIQTNFTYPINLLPATTAWQMVTWTELIGSGLLVLGLGTRLSAVALLVIDIVAWLSVHAANGYNVCDNGYKLPLIYLLILAVIILSGPGKASLDHLFRRWCARQTL